MKLESLNLWVEKALLTEYGDQGYGFVGFIMGVFRDGLIDCNTASLSSYDRDFQYELTKLLTYLQSEEAEYFIRDRDTMERYCNARFNDHIPYHFKRELWGFRVLTEKYAWYIGCTPWHEQRHFALYCYDRDVLMRALAEERGLPEACYGVLPFTGERIYIRFAENTFGRISSQGDNVFDNRKIVSEQNVILGVSAAQQSAMENGVIYGWDTPVADPKNYDENGHWYIPIPQGKGGR